ncbi:MAG TPA: GNAT family N-acetyltransferase [Chlamydiales bacterium]|nr:GNAT family N-acetyltransferase [Chlamydiales bacterium]
MKYILHFLLLISQAYSLETESFRTRPARLEDLDVLYELVCELAVFEGKDREILPVTKANLQRYGFGPTPFYHVELAENQNGTVGYALYFYGFSGHQGTPLIYVDDLYVRPSERGHGIGSGLLKQLARYAKEMGCCRMEWHAFDWNEKAISFYEHLGGTLRKDLLLFRLEKEAYYQMAE